MRAPDTKATSKGVAFSFCTMRGILKDTKCIHMTAFQYETSSDPNQQFSVSFRSCERTPLSWKHELPLAARAIANEAGSRPLWLCFSGGLNSEIMCQTFFDLGIHFSVLTLKYANHMNIHDIYFAEEWCRTHGVPQKIVEVDMHAFLTRDVFTYAKQGYVTANVFRYVQIRLLEIVDSMGGYAVLGGGEQLYRSDSESLETFLAFDGGYKLPLEWSIRHGMRHEPYFYFRTPELVRAYLHLPIVDFAIQHPSLFRHESNAYVFKRFVLQSEFPHIAKRKKFNGFEKLSTLRGASESQLKVLYPQLPLLCRVSILSLKEMLDSELRIPSQKSRSAHDASTGGVSPC